MKTLEQLTQEAEKKIREVFDGWMEEENLFHIATMNKMSGRQLELTITAVMEFSQDLRTKIKKQSEDIKIAVAQLSIAHNRLNCFSPEWYLHQDISNTVKNALEVLIDWQPLPQMPKK